jgi:ribonuclease D
MDHPKTRISEIQAPIPYKLISTRESYRSMLERLAAAPRLAVDMEADSLYHYFEKVCLIQISTDKETYIIDPLEVSEVDRLAPLMSSPSVEKVFHAAGYDVYSLRRDYGFEFLNIFDTHISAQLLGHQYLGLSALMEQLLGIHHSKRRQRDDWSRRPLAFEQLQYAAMDTHHLLSLRDVLENDLRKMGRLSWAQEEFEAAATTERREKEFDAEGFRRIKGSGKLPPQDQVVSRALYIWRDKAARKLNVPAFKVMNNSVLLDLVRKPPLSPREMLKRPGISYRVARKFSGEIVRTIAEAKRRDPSSLNAAAGNGWRSPSRTAKLRLDALKLWRKQKARDLKLHVGVIFPGNLLESLVEYPPANLHELANLAGVRQWRVREFGEEVLRLLNNHEPQMDGS